MKQGKALLLIVGVAGLAILWGLGVAQIQKRTVVVEQEAITGDTTDLGQPTGEDPLAVMNNLVQAHYRQGKINYEGVLRLFDENEATPRLMEEKPFRYTLFGQNYVYIIGKVEIIRKDQRFILIDHEENVIAITPVEKNPAPKMTPGFDLEKFRQLMQQQAAAAKVTVKGPFKILTVEGLKEAGMQGYSIYYSPLDHRIQKINIDMWQLTPLEEGERTGASGKGGAPVEEGDESVDAFNYRMAIEYSAQKEETTTSFDPEKKYFSGSGKKITLKAPYSAYELINQE
ncbi:hypothetical protein [Paraflavitalea speifideaquila]|uniref:hypothetical protein n=1 Tax=Paraflavitalea speifideaquila TaxID=3076558 RepID=UPI0028E7B512|nr:hypothetical protein [Paraflavitalea speifideiaquila]